jgi:hypothetical protein
VPDDQDSLPIPAQRQIIEEASHAADRLPPAFPAWIRLIQVLTPVAVHFGSRHSVVLPVVALA